MNRPKYVASCSGGKDSVATLLLAARHTVEEINFMSYFDASSRQSLIRDMKNTPLSDMDAEMSEMLCRMVKRLEKMSDEEFSALYIAPDTLMD